MSRPILLALAAGSAAVLLSLAATVPDAAAGSSAISAIQRASTGPSGQQANDISFAPRFSPDGRSLAFVSRATTLSKGTKGEAHLYVKTLATKALRRVDETAAGIGGDYDAYPDYAFSPDGRKIIFASDARNLVPGDSNFSTDVFEKDLVTGSIRRLSLTKAGKQVNGASAYPVYSPNGKSIAFASSASNLLPGDRNGKMDVFLKDLTTGTITLLSRTWKNGQGDDASYRPVFSPDGSQIAFMSWARNLIKNDITGGTDMFVRSVATNDIRRVNEPVDGSPDLYPNEAQRPVFTPDSKWALFSTQESFIVQNDFNGRMDVFAKRLSDGFVVRVSVTDAGGELNGGSLEPTYGKASRFFAFATSAPNLASDDLNGHYDVYWKPGGSKPTVRVSTTVAGGEGNDDSYAPAFAPNGTMIAFESLASNLVARDTNGVKDIFVVTLK